MSAVGLGLTRRRWFSSAGKYPILLGIILVASLFFGINVGKTAAAEQQDVYLSPSRIEVGVPTEVELRILDPKLVCTDKSEVRLTVGAFSDRILGEMIRDSQNHYAAPNVEIRGVVRSFEVGTVPLQQTANGWQGRVIVTLPEDLMFVSISADEFSTDMLNLWHIDSVQRYLEVEPAGAAADREIRVLIDGVRYAFDPPPVIIEGRTLVPMRALFEKLGARVNWEPDTRTAIGKRNDTEVHIPIGSNFPTVNGTPVEINVPADIIDGRTFLPLRFVSEALGDTVGYDGETRTVTVASSRGKSTIKAKPERENVALGERGEASLTYHVHVSPGKDGLVEAVLEGEIKGTLTFSVVDFEWIDFAGNIYDVEAKSGDGKSLSVTPVSSGWLVSAGSAEESLDKITFTYSFGVTLQEDTNWGSNYVRVTEYDEALLFNGAVFAYPDLMVNDVQVAFHIPDAWTVGTTFIPTGNNTYSVEGVPNLHTELHHSATRMGIVEKQVTRKCGDLEISFLAFQSRNQNHGLTEFWTEAYGNTPEEQMEEYLDMLCRSIRYGTELFGFWPGGSRYLVTTRLTEADAIHSSTGFTHWMQAFPREQLPQLPHHVLHAWIWLSEDAPIKMAAPEWWWIMEGVPSYYETELTTRFTGDDQWLGLHYLHYLILQRADQFDLLEKLTVHFYALGHMRALAMDRAIREATGDEKSLDNLLTLLGHRFGINRQHFNRHQMIEAVNEVTGTDLTDFYNSYFAGITGRGFAVRELPPVEQYIEEYREPFFKWIDSFVAIPGNEARGSRTMFLIALELGLHGGTVMEVDSEHFIACRTGIFNLGPFRSKLASLGRPITEQDVINALAELTAVNQSDFFDFYTVGDYQPQLAEIQKWLN